MSKEIIVLTLIMFLLCPLANAEQQKQKSEPIKVLSSNEQMHTVMGNERSLVYQVKPLVPMQFEVNGPGKLKLSFIKNYIPSDLAAAKQPSGFSILKNGVFLETVQASAVEVGGFVYEETKSVFPGKAVVWTVEVAEESWNIGIMISPDALQGGAVQLDFEVPKAEEPALIPLVPLVPLVPPTVASEQAAQPAQSAEPVAEQAKPVEAAIPAEEEALAPTPVDEIPSEAAAEQAPAEEAIPAGEEPKKEKKYVMIEPRLGINLGIQSVQTADETKTEANPAFTVGLGLRYILPVMSERFRIGVGIDWHRYEFNRSITSPKKASLNVKLTSIPMLVEFDAFILTEGIFRPFVGMGVGGTYVVMEYLSEPDDNDVLSRKVETKAWTYGVAFWAGCQFYVWNGGPFAKVKYLISSKDYDDLSNAQHGGLQILAGYQFEF